MPFPKDEVTPPVHKDVSYSVYSLDRFVQKLMDFIQSPKTINYFKKFCKCKHHLSIINLWQNKTTYYCQRILRT